MKIRNRVLIGNGKHLKKENNGGGMNKDGKKNNVQKRTEKEKWQENEWRANEIQERNVP